MKRLLTFILMFSFWHFAAPAQPLPKIKAGDPLPANLFIELAKAVNPGVVNIFTTYLPKNRFQGPNGRQMQDPFFDLFQQFMGPNPYRARPMQALGSGFIIREDGLIVTNNHVIDRADVIKVQIDEKTKESFDAKVIGKDEATDLALIKISAKRKLPALKLGTSSNLQVGEWVAAFGNPFGHGHSMTKGVISAIGRELDELNLSPFIQTDASINPGNSGGPLVNTQGEVIGVNTAIDARAQGIGFAIPIDNAKTIIAQLEKSGTVERGFVGLNLVDVNEENADELDMSESRGAMVLEVVPGSPADKAGLQPYDLVVSFDGVTIKTSNDLIKAVKSTPIGKKVSVGLMRNTKSKTVTLEVVSAKDLAKTQSLRPQNKKPRYESFVAPFNLGFALANYSSAVAQEFNLPRSQQNHPVVVDVAPGSEAEVAGLVPGDIVLDVNRTRVEKSSDVFRSLRRGGMNVLRVLKRDRVVLISLRVR